MKFMVGQTGLKLSFVGQCGCLSLVWPTVAQLGFSLVLTLCEFNALFFVSSQYVYKFDCFPVMIH